MGGGREGRGERDREGGRERDRGRVGGWEERGLREKEGGTEGERERAPRRPRPVRAAWRPLLRGAPGGCWAVT